MQTRILISVLLFAATLATPCAYAEESPFGDFGTTSEFEVETGSTPEADKKSWRISTAYNLGMALEPPQQVNTHRGEVRLQWEKLLEKKYFVEFDGKVLARFSGDQNLAASESYNTDTKIRSLYVQTSGDLWGAKAGYQTVTLGKLDMFPAVDVLSPWDYSEFAFTAPEDARVSQPWLRLSRHQDKDTFEFLWAPVPLANQYPGSSASSLLALILGTTNFDLNAAEPYANNEGEAAIRWERIGEKRDLSFTLASVLQNDPLIEPLDLALPTPLYGLSYPRYGVAGVGTNLTSGNFLWKLEAAYQHGLSLFDTQLRQVNGLQVAGGFDYVSTNQTSVSVEAGHQHLFLPAGSTAAADSSQIGMRISRNFRNETLGVVYYAGYQLQDRYLTQSASLRYAYSDSVSAELVATVFDVGNSASQYAFTDGWDQLAFRLTISH